MARRGSLADLSSHMSLPLAHTPYPYYSLNSSSVAAKVVEWYSLKKVGRLSLIMQEPVVRPTRSLVLHLLTEEGNLPLLASQDVKCNTPHCSSYPRESL